MFDLQGVSLYSRYCITGSRDFVSFGSLSAVSVIKDSSGRVISEKSTPTSITGVTTCASGRPGSEFAYDEIKTLSRATTYSLTVTATIDGSQYSTEKTFTTVGGSTQATQSESIQPPGLGGYAVVHPDGRVCGVIVATSADPYGNGGTMPIEYMGCPVGSRIAFQTKASPSGNVAGWSGENVRYDGNQFTVNSGSSQTTIRDGLATESSGRVFDTGSGATVVPATTSPTTPTTSDTRTVTSETQTVTSDTRTVTTGTGDTSTTTSSGAETQTATNSSGATSASSSSTSTSTPSTSSSTVNPTSSNVILGSSSELRSAITTLVRDTSEKRNISNFLKRLEGAVSATRSSQIRLPISSLVEETYQSQTPSICQASGQLVTRLQRGTCVVLVSIKDSVGNIFAVTREIVFRR